MSGQIGDDDGWLKALGPFAPAAAPSVPPGEGVADGVAAVINIAGWPIIGPTPDVKFAGVIERKPPW